MITLDALDQEASQAAAAWARAQAQRDERARVAAEAKEAERKEAYLLPLLPLLGQDLIETLSGHVVLDSHDTHLALTYRGANIRVSGPYRDGEYQIEPTSYCAVGVRSPAGVTASAGVLRATLLALVGQIRVLLEKAAIDAADQERRRLAWEERQARELAELAAADALLREQATAINARADAAIAAQRASLWQWPEGVQITFYRVRWLTAPAGAGEGSSPDYDHGFTTGHELGPDGRLELHATRNWNGHETGDRVVYLFPLAHLPVFEELTASSIADLPDPLRLPVRARVQRAWVRHHALQTNHGYEDPEDVGKLPVTWVRALAEAQA